MAEGFAARLAERQGPHAGAGAHGGEVRAPGRADAGEGGVDGAEALIERQLLNADKALGQGAASAARAAW